VRGTVEGAAPEGRNILTQRFSVGKGAKPNPSPGGTTDVPADFRPRPTFSEVSIPMVEELEQEYTALRGKVHDLQEYL